MNDICTRCEEDCVFACMGCGRCFYCCGCDQMESDLWETQLYFAYADFVSSLTPKGRDGFVRPAQTALERIRKLS